MFMFMKKGKVQWWNKGTRKGMVLAETSGDAHKLRRWLQQQCKGGLSVAEIGTVENEDLAKHIKASSEQGANCVFVLGSWDDNDNPVFNVKDFD